MVTQCSHHSVSNRHLQPAPIRHSLIAKRSKAPVLELIVPPRVFCPTTTETGKDTNKITLQELNSLDQQNFTERLSTLFEGPPWIVSAAWRDRPFQDIEHLHSALCQVMYNAPVAQQIALLQAHPDLVGRAALAGTLTPASTAEQASAGLDRLSPDEITTFTNYNQAYRERFGFPFVICARENKKDQILSGFQTRLHNTREQELHTALAEVAKICMFRLRDLVFQDDPIL